MVETNQRIPNTISMHRETPTEHGTASHIDGHIRSKAFNVEMIHCIH